MHQPRYWWLAAAKNPLNDFGMSQGISGLPRFLSGF